jgi:hypothetical protein
VLGRGRFERHRRRREALQRARDDYVQHEFAGAAEAPAAADELEPLAADDRYLLGEAAWWSGDHRAELKRLPRTTPWSVAYA